MGKKVAIGISGGVDSSVAAALLLEQGYEVTGVFVEAYNDGKCRTDEDKRDALRVASKLGIKFEVLDLRKEYQVKVVNYFVEEYKAGRTPNPDVVCNGEIKFGLLLDYVLQKGFEYLATGHYARILQVNPKSEIRNQKLQSNNFFLQRPRDLSKDQTYFLWKVGAEKLKYVIFPLGELTKKEVRAKAKLLGLPNADKPDSMGVCMMGELSVGEFLKDKIGEKEGEVVMRIGKKFRTNVSSELKVIGKHKGVWFFTEGQRGGWEVDSGEQTSQMPALYVLKKDVKNNVLVVGEREECYRKQFLITNVKFLINKKNLFVRIRNLGELHAVTSCHSVTEGTEILLEKPVFAPAPGQSAVFYDEQGVVAGGAIIC